MRCGFSLWEVGQLNLGWRQLGLCEEMLRKQIRFQGAVANPIIAVLQWWHIGASRNAWSPRMRRSSSGTGAEIAAFQLVFLFLHGFPFVYGFFPGATPMKNGACPGPGRARTSWMSCTPARCGRTPTGPTKVPPCTG